MTEPIKGSGKYSRLIPDITTPAQLRAFMAAAESDPKVAEKLRLWLITIPEQPRAVLLALLEEGEDLGARVTRD
jgi:hypothetical protein